MKTSAGQNDPAPILLFQSNSGLQRPGQTHARRTQLGLSIIHGIYFLFADETLADTALW